MQKQKLDKLFSPKSIAIIGASDKEGKVGAVITKNILSLGYHGKIVFVNQSYDTLFAQQCYHSISEIPEEVDLGIVAVPARFVLDVVKQGSQKIKNFVIISAGFGEIGEEGKKMEQQLALLAEEKKLNILGPNCLGFIAPKLKLNASFAGGMPEAGNVSFVSQSGALAVALMDIAREQNLSFSSIISIGNKMQIDEAELIEYLSEDKNTKVIALYLEGIKNGEAFIEAAGKASKKKPIIVLKAGKSQKAQEAITSHTGALAGSDAIVEVALKKCGAIRAENLEEFFDLIALFSKYEAPKSGNVAVVTNAGGAGVLSADAFEGKNVALFDFDEKTKTKIAERLPGEASANNPIDVLGDAMEDRYELVLSEIEKNKNIGAMIAILTPQDQTPVMEIAKKIVEAQKKTKKILIASFVGGERIKEEVAFLQSNNVVNFPFPERAVKALDAFWKWMSEKDAADFSGKKPTSKAKRIESVHRIIHKAKTEGRSALYYSEAAETMHLYGIPAVDAQNILPLQNIPEVHDYPVVIKIDSDKVLHKSDKQALIANIKSRQDLELAVKKLRTNFPHERIIIQRQNAIQTEAILGIKYDSTFGPVIVTGLGGLYTEIFKKVDFLVPPISDEEIKKTLLEGSMGFLFGSARGQKPYDVKEFSKIIKGLIEFSHEISGIREFDINPIFIYNDGRKALAVDIKIVI